MVVRAVGANNGAHGCRQAYEVAGIVFAARTLFAFTLGAFLGAATRRTVAAMAATAAGWLAVAWPSVVYLRPLIEKPVDVPADSNLIANGWGIHNWVQDRSGHRLGVARLVNLHIHSGGRAEVSSRDFSVWLAEHGYTQWASYQPDSRFWHLQTIEATAYSLLALAFGAATMWWVRRRAA
jgi:hypothetical protein